MNTVLIDTEGIKTPEWIADLEAFLNRVLIDMGRNNWEVSVVLCNDETMTRINKEFRDKDAPTDVLSFPQIESAEEIPENGPFLAGDIIVSLDSVRLNAEEFSVPANEEFKRVLIHGLMHLSGWDHSTNDPGEPMLLEQERVLSAYKDVKAFIL